MSTSLNFVAIAAVSLLLLAAAQVASAARTTVIIHAIPVPENWMWSEARLWHCQMEEAAEGGTCSGVEEAMRRLVADQKQRGDVIMGVEELNNAWDVAEELPMKCGVVSSPSKCRLNSRFSSS
ncbi:hypothetical protein LINPERPRIM_LOCUS14173 [Linum perenne]